MKIEYAESKIDCGLSGFSTISLSPIPRLGDEKVQHCSAADVIDHSQAHVSDMFTALLKTYCEYESVSRLRKRAEPLQLPFFSEEWEVAHYGADLRIVQPVNSTGKIRLP